MKHSKFTNIEQFRHIQYEIRQSSADIGKDDNNEPVFDYSLKKPILKAKGTVKLHGTNASICMNSSEFWSQSKDKIISVEKDNIGFAAFVSSKEESFKKIINNISIKNNLSLEKYTICLYGEWCGGKIQKGVALNLLPKMFVIFAVKVIPNNDEESYYIDSDKERDEDNKIYNINDFESYELEIDFNNPSVSINMMEELTQMVDKQCPVGTKLGVIGHGEGIVWVVHYKDSRLCWKVKGKSHSSSKVKVLKTIDLEKLSIVEKCAEEICHQWRFEQGIIQIFGVDYENTINRKKLGEYLKWISTDTLKEEYDIIKSYGLDTKEIIPEVSKRAKIYFFEIEKLGMRKEIE